MNLRARLANARGGLLLLPWVVLVGLTLREGPYGLAEEGAKALLVAWSIGDAVASAAFALGAPDIRVILFLPLGFFWPGQVIAAKVLTLLVMAGAGMGLYRWRRREEQGEAALLATGLLLIAPATWTPSTRCRRDLSCWRPWPCRTGSSLPCAGNRDRSAARSSRSWRPVRPRSACIRPVSPIRWCC